MQKEKRTYQDWVSEVYALTKKRRKRDLDLHLGTDAKEACAASYDESQLLELKKVIHSQHLNCSVYYEALDHYLRTRAEPFQAMLTTWMSGAKAYVRDNVIPFNDAIDWCQNAPDPEDRRTLAKELLALCRFLTQFSHATWEAITGTLRDTFGYSTYLSYNEEKRNTSIRREASRARDFLDKTRNKYLNVIQDVVPHVCRVPFKEATRYDAIYLLGLRYLDHLFPSQFDMATVGEFFEQMGISLRDNPSIVVHEVKSGKQSYCVPIEIPGEIHVITGKVTGWLDLESIFHELGHAFSFLHTNPKLPIEIKDFFHSAALAESYAFLLQRMCMSSPFLEEVMKLDTQKARFISRIHSLKWLTLARRYAAKLLVETKNFDGVDLLEGKQFYSDTMKEETGFFYQPDTYLFDLMPDFYSVDYFLGFIGGAAMEKYLTDRFGEKWFLDSSSWNLLKDWWFEGNSLQLPEFIEKKTNTPLSLFPLVSQFSEIDIRNKELLEMV